MEKTLDLMNCGQELTFDALSQGIRQLHEHFAAKAKHAVNVALTLRNWLIGCYIAEYQLHGADRAKYGDKIVTTLAHALKDVSNCSRQELYKYLSFYKTYPRIVETVYRQLPDPLGESLPLPIVGTLSTQLENTNASSEQLNKNDTYGLFTNLSYSHFELLVGVEDSTARTFYETECIRGCWSVRELKRQIGSMFYERTALSTNKQKMSEMANANAERDTLALTIRDPYVFDFLGLKVREVVNEKTLEDALIGKLQAFLLEPSRKVKQIILLESRTIPRCQSRQFLLCRCTCDAW